MRGGEREAERGLPWQSRQLVRKLRRSRKRETDRQTRVAESQIIKGARKGWMYLEPDHTGGEDVVPT